MFPFQVHLSVK